MIDMSMAFREMTVVVWAVLGWAAGLGAPAPASPEPASMVGAVAVQQDRAVAAEGTERGSLPFFYDLHTFRGENGATAVVTAVAVPVGELSSERVDGQVRYRFDVSFVLADTTHRDVYWTFDSVTVSVPSRFRGRHLLHTYVEVEAEPSLSTLQRVIVTDATSPGSGQLYSTPFAIPDYSGDDLMLSDIALGLPDSRSGWSRPGSPLALLPTTEFPESSFDVYYEIYNLPEGRPYETEISIQRLGDDDDEDERPIRTTFSGEASVRDDGAVGELRLVESALPKGRYRLTVTVTDRSDGRQASRSRLVEVRGGRDGATLVPALPWRERGGA